MSKARRTRDAMERLRLNVEVGRSELPPFVSPFNAKFISVAIGLKRAKKPGTQAK